LEMVLASDLRRLRSKGYNVDRILRQQAYQKRIMEEERRKQQAEQEQQEKNRRKSEKQMEAQGLTTVAPPPPYDEQPLEEPKSPIRSPKMPGAFEPDSPPQGLLKKRGKDLMSQMANWGKQLSSNSHGSSQLPNSPSGPITTQPVAEPTPAQDVTKSERNITQNLSSAINACRSHTSSHVFNPPSTTTVEHAQGSYCDTRPAQNISLVETTSGGIKFFLAHDALPQADLILAANRASIDRFSFLLLDLASIFGLAPQNLHVFLDPMASSIAFNADGALFFNFHFFAQLHLAAFLPQAAGTSADARIDAVAYWWVTLCHELAHNLVKEHSAAHSFYTESFASQYFARALRKALTYGQVEKSGTRLIPVD